MRPERRREAPRQQPHRHRPSGHRALATNPTSETLPQGSSRRPSPVLQRPRRQHSRRPRLPQPWQNPPARWVRLMPQAPSLFPPQLPPSGVPTRQAQLVLLVPLAQLAQLARTRPIRQQSWQQGPEWSALAHRPTEDHQATGRRPSWGRRPPSWAADSRAGASGAGGMPTAKALACQA